MPISPIDIVTQGYLCNPLSVVVDGYLCTVTVSPPIPPDIIPDRTPIHIGGGGYTGRLVGDYKNPDKFWKDDETSGTTEEKKVKLITITVEKDNKKYVESLATEDLSIEAKDVKFEIIEEKSDISIKIWFDK